MRRSIFLKTSMQDRAIWNKFNKGLFQLYSEFLFYNNNFLMVIKNWTLPAHIIKEQLEQQAFRAKTSSVTRSLYCVFPALYSWLTTVASLIKSESNPCRRFYPIMEKYSINSTSQCYGWLFPFHRCYLTLGGFNAFWRIFLQTILPGNQDLCLKLKSNSKKVCMNKMLSTLTFP